MFQFLHNLLFSDKELNGKIKTDVSLNWPISFLFHLELVFKQSTFDIIRLQTGCSHMEVATELRVSQSIIVRLQQRYRETGRVTERYTSGRPLATSHADHCFIVNSALWNGTQLQEHFREVRCTQVSRQTIRNCLHQGGLHAGWPARAPDETTSHTRHRLTWAKEHLRWTRDQRASALFCWAENDGCQRCWRPQGECYA